MGWYVEAKGARKDPALIAFEGLSANELATSNDFYTAMVNDAAYDRTILIKLAMPLQTDLMISGLVEELQISPKNSVSTHFILFLFIYFHFILLYYFFMCVSYL